jgi:hypothetical protein
MNHSHLLQYINLGASFNFYFLGAAKRTTYWENVVPTFLLLTFCPFWKVLAIEENGSLTMWLHLTWDIRPMLQIVVSGGNLISFLLKIEDIIFLTSNSFHALRPAHHLNSTPGCWSKISSFLCLLISYQITSQSSKTCVIGGKGVKVNITILFTTG